MVERFANKDVRELVEAIERRDGFKVEIAGKHAKVYFGDENDPESFRPVLDRDSSRPITISTTPSSSNFWDDAVSQLLRSKVLLDDPRKEGQRGLTDEDRERRQQEREEREEKREQRQELVSAAAEEARERARTLAVLHERAERTFGPIGVWKPAAGGSGGGRGSISEVARVMYAWGKRVGIDPMPASAASTNEAIKRLYSGAGGFKENTANLVRRFLDELDRAPNSARRYHELLREELGIGETRAAVSAEPEPETEPEAAPEAEPEAEPEPVGVTEGNGDRVTGPAREALLAERLELAKALTERNEEKAQLEQALARKEEEIAYADEQRKKAIADAEKAQEDAAVATAEMRRLQAAPPANGKVPELAFEALGEMIGQHVTAGPESDLDSVLEMLNEKKERAVALAKRIAAVELGISS